MNLIKHIRFTLSFSLLSKCLNQLSSQTFYVASSLTMIFFVLTLKLLSAPQTFPSFASDYEEWKKKELAGQNTTTLIAEESERIWSAPLYPTLLDPLSVYRKDREQFLSSAYFRAAQAELEEAKRADRILIEERKAIEYEQESIKNPLWWKAIEENDRLNRKKERVYQQYHKESVERYDAAGRNLDRMLLFEESSDEVWQSPLKNSPLWIEERKKSYRMLSVHLVALGEREAALPYLLAYYKFPDTGKEWPLHHYLSLSYDYLYRVRLKNSGISDFALRKLRRLRNLHRMLAVELRFGIQSRESDWVRAYIYQDELASPRSQLPNRNPMDYPQGDVPKL